MEEFDNNNFLRFEFIDSGGYKTLVDKEYEGDDKLEELMYQIKYALLACGFHEDLVNQYIVLDE